MEIGRAGTPATPFRLPEAPSRPARPDTRRIGPRSRRRIGDRPALCVDDLHARLPSSVRFDPIIATLHRRCHPLARFEAYGTPGEPRRTGRVPNREGYRRVRRNGRRPGKASFVDQHPAPFRAYPWCEEGSVVRRLPTPRRAGPGISRRRARHDENVFVVPFDGIGEATFDGRPESNQRLFECVRFVKRERRIVPVSGLLDETVDGRRSAIPQARRAGEPEPGGIVDRRVEAAERQQPRLLFDKPGEKPAPDTARVVFGQPRINEQPSVFRQPFPRSRRKSGKSK